jgi:hypothetical protein
MENTMAYTDRYYINLEPTVRKVLRGEPYTTYALMGMYDNCMGELKEITEEHRRSFPMLKEGVLYDIKELTVVRAFITQERKDDGGASPIVVTQNLRNESYMTIIICVSKLHMHAMLNKNLFDHRSFGALLNTFVEMVKQRR